MGKKPVTWMPGLSEELVWQWETIISRQNKQINTGNLYYGEMNLPSKELRNMRKAEGMKLNIAECLSGLLNIFCHADVALLLYSLVEY